MNRQLALIVALPVAIVLVMAALTPAQVHPDFLSNDAISPITRAGASDVRGVALARSESSSSGYRRTRWSDLVLPSWSARRPFSSDDIAKLADTDPRAQVLLSQLRTAWNAAPANPALNGIAIRTAGYVVPIENSGDGLKEFLLVPYYGACIHIPPPPANQIIDVSTRQPVRGVSSMDPVWVSGVLNIVHTIHDSGASSYAMQADDVELYTGPSQ